MNVALALVITQSALSDIDDRRRVCGEASFSPPSPPLKSSLLLGLRTINEHTPSSWRHATRSPSSNFIPRCSSPVKKRWYSHPPTDTLSFPSPSTPPTISPKPPTSYGTPLQKAHTSPFSLNTISQTGCLKTLSSCPFASNGRIICTNIKSWPKSSGYASCRAQ